MSVDVGPQDQRSRRARRLLTAAVVGMTLQSLGFIVDTTWSGALVVGAWIGMLLALVLLGRRPPARFRRHRTPPPVLPEHFDREQFAVVLLSGVSWLMPSLWLEDHDVGFLAVGLVVGSGFLLALLVGEGRRLVLDRRARTGTSST